MSYPEKSVLSCVIFHLKLLHLYDFQACKYQLKYCILSQFIHAIWFVWRDVGCWKCGMLEVAYWACKKLGDVWMLEMLDIGNRGCWEFVMLEVWDVRDVGYWGCGMFRMWDVRDVTFRDVGCLGCGTFRM